MPVESMYLDAGEWDTKIRSCARHICFSAFNEPEVEGRTVISLQGNVCHNFSAERAEEGRNVIDAVHEYIAGQRRDNKRIIISCWSAGSRERLASILRDHNIQALTEVSTWIDVRNLEPHVIALAITELERGFLTPELLVLSEQDILGERLVRRSGKKRKASDFISELSSLGPGDFVVHVDHGIGQF